VENLVVTRGSFWKGRRVLVTGHTGFKGAWLCLWLKELGASVCGLSLAPEGSPSLYEAAALGGRVEEAIGDILSEAFVREATARFQPDVVFHLAAQALVRRSYEEPVATFASNVMGTAHVLEAARATPSVRGVVVVTSDKCYENFEWPFAYRENDRMGGRDPYSASKGCAELLVSSYRQSFFANASTPVGLASARAGNVIGGGDWAADRLVVDCMRAFVRGETVIVRNPHAIRPWQHVLDALRGYLLLAQRLLDDPAGYSEGWNFSPSTSEARDVREIVERVCGLWGDGASWRHEGAVAAAPHEATFLRLDSSLAQCRLGWRSLLPLDEALRWTVEWYRRVAGGAAAYAECTAQIRDFIRLEERSRDA
jgi:CDP-glucose 4,6-dehydratase